MDEKTTMAQGLHSTDDSAGYDAACKRVLSEKAILARIMKACLAEYRDCSVRDIEEKYIEGQPQVSSVPVLPDEEGSVISGLDTEDKSVHEGTVTYDIRFRAIAPDSGELIGLIVNVEAQNDFYPGYPLTKRGIYYCCRMISSQYGREFTGSHYEKLKKVYSIWICMNPPKNAEDTSLISHTFQDAYYSRRPQKNMIFHSDQGGQYRSLEFRNLLLGHKVRQSFSAPGVPYDNAPMESFFASLKVEEIHRFHYTGKGDLTASLRDYISFYNNRRPHTSIGDRTPAEAENEYFQRTSTIAVTSCAL